jgi:hypothetical protein
MLFHIAIRINRIICFIPLLYYPKCIWYAITMVLRCKDSTNGLWVGSFHASFGFWCVVGSKCCRWTLIEMCDNQLVQLREKIRIRYTWWTTKEKVRAIFLGKKWIWNGLPKKEKYSENVWKRGYRSKMDCHIKINIVKILKKGLKWTIK